MKHLLDFEKPIVELQSKLDELRRSPDSNSLGINLEEEIKQMEAKIEGTRKQIFSNLTPWQRVQLARHPLRPYALDYIQRVFSNFSELHGDRAYADDAAIIGGFAYLEDQKVLVLGTQKGRDTKENIKRNFGSAHPEGYRKALRLMKMANKFNLPIIALIDTAGAYPGVAAEERHIAEAIAVNLREMMIMETPILALVIGEGGSGGALGLGVADRVLILENAYYSVISPEGCAAILWKDRKASMQAAESLRITAKDLLHFGLVDEIIKEPLGGAHQDYEKITQSVRESLSRHLKELMKFSPRKRLSLRYNKFRNHGEFFEAPPEETEEEVVVETVAQPENQSSSSAPDGVEDHHSSDSSETGQGAPATQTLPQEESGDSNTNSSSDTPEVIGVAADSKSKDAS